MTSHEDIITTIVRIKENIQFSRAALTLIAQGVALFGEPENDPAMKLEILSTLESLMNGINKARAELKEGYDIIMSHADEHNISIPPFDFTTMDKAAQANQDEIRRLRQFI